MKSGGGVLCVSVLQLVVGLALLGIYEAYKVSVHRSDRRVLDAPPPRHPRPLTSSANAIPTASHTWRTPSFRALQKQFFEGKTDKGTTVLTTTSTPMDLVFFLSILNNIFAFFGLAGVINSQKELVRPRYHGATRNRRRRTRTDDARNPAFHLRARDPSGYIVLRVQHSPDRAVLPPLRRCHRRQHH